MLKIESLKSADIAAVLEISAQQFGAAGWQADLFLQELAKDGHFAFVAKIDAQVVAFLFVMKTYGERGDEFNILNIATKKQFENRGIGTELMGFLVKFARGLAIKSLWLEVREGNFNAIKFYRNWGFQTDYVRKNYYADGENALVMSLIV